jgi:hypothetical protein
MRRWLSRRRFVAALAGGGVAATLRPDQAAANHCHWERVAGPYCSVDGDAYTYYCYECCYESGCRNVWCGWFNLGTCR